jgi:hypothetical protein
MSKLTIVLRDSMPSTSRDVGFVSRLCTGTRPRHEAPAREARSSSWLMRSGGQRLGERQLLGGTGPGRATRQRPAGPIRPVPNGTEVERVALVPIGAVEKHRVHVWGVFLRRIAPGRLSQLLDGVGLDRVGRGRRGGRSRPPTIRVTRLGWSQGNRSSDGAKPDRAHTRAAIAAVSALHTFARSRAACPTGGTFVSDSSSPFHRGGAT